MSPDTKMSFMEEQALVSAETGIALLRSYGWDREKIMKMTADAINETDAKLREREKLAK